MIFVPRAFEGVADSPSVFGLSVANACRYILVYPQGCDVSNHLSLFLCVADYDKLLPGWSHFAQFTIAVVNKDPKKSKYSGAPCPSTNVPSGAGDCCTGFPLLPFRRSPL